MTVTTVMSVTTVSAVSAVSAVPAVTTLTTSPRSFWDFLYKKVRGVKGFSITQMPRKSARKSVPIKKL